MPASVNNTISVADYNAIRNIVASVMGTGSGSRGYGQTVNSVVRATNARISQTDWDNLRFDLLNARIHQNGAAALAEINEGQTVSAGTINVYETLRTLTDNNRFIVADGQYLTFGANPNGSNLIVSRNYDGSAWKNEISTVLTVTFTDSNRARYFFNSGGTVRIQSARTATPSVSRTDAQNNAWTSLLGSAGLREFGGNSPSRNFYNLTTSFQEFYSLALSVYTNNRYVLEASCNCTGANNSTGTANIVYIRARFIDGYSDPPGGFAGQFPPEDGVDGTFSVSVSEKRATGTLLPSGNFTIARPTYSLSSLTGS